MTGLARVQSIQMDGCGSYWGEINIRVHPSCLISTSPASFCSKPDRIGKNNPLILYSVQFKKTFLEQFFYFYFTLHEHLAAEERRYGSSDTT